MVQAIRFTITLPGTYSYENENENLQLNINFLHINQAISSTITLNMRMSAHS